MTPSRLRGSKNYVFNRRVKGVGRIQLSSRTSKLKEFHYRDGLLTKLIEAGRLEPLRMLKRPDGLTILDLVDADQRDMLLQVADRYLLRKPLRAEVDFWLPDSAPAPSSRRRYKVGWERFLAVARSIRELGAEPVIEDLRFVAYPKLRRAWNAGPADWNRTRGAVSAFLSVYLGSKFHPFRLEVMGRFRMQTEPRGRVPDIPIGAFWQIVTAADERCGPAYVAMAALGVGPGEYLTLQRDDLHPDDLEVHVRGTKNQHRDRYVAVDARLWGWIDRAIPAPLQERWLGVYWRRACQAAEVVGVRMYDLRHLSAQLAGDRGVTDRDLTVHLGHSNPGMSHRYSRRRTARLVAAAVAEGLLEGRSA